MPRTILQLLHFYRAAEQRAGRIERFYHIAGRTVCLRFAGPALVAKLTPSFAHLETTATATPDLVVCLADQQSSGVAMPPKAGAPGMYHSQQTNHYLYLHEDEQWQEAFLPRFGLALFAIADSACYPPYAQAAPLRNILLWWLAQQGRYGLHAAAVGDTTGVALIVGNGGAGKSTTAIACLQAGFTYLGDDFCVLDFAPTPCVHSLYSSGKLCDDSRQWLNPVATAASGVRDQHKMIYQWHPHCKTQLPSSLPIRAVLLPQISDRATTTVCPARPAAAFTALTTTTLRVMSLPTGTFNPVLRAISHLVGQVPCYHLELGGVTAELPATILRVLEQPRP